jgi:peptidoglycan/xylan/chitin deacetylase (PgdA/CDA1 family)
VSADTFSEQMDYLQDNGYTTIPISLLVKAIREGADLPERPIVITFDDGNLDIYENAYPILQKYPFTATLYLVLNYLDHDTFLSTDQAAELMNAGWEIGSHSISHPDLYGMQIDTYSEVANSKKALVKILGAPVNTFAYPFGQTDADITAKVKDAYTAAVGLGNGYTHSLASIYYLKRIEIRSETDLTTFTNALPW